MDRCSSTRSASLARVSAALARCREQGAGEIHKGLVDGKRLYQRRQLSHHCPQLAAHGGVFLHVGFDDRGVGAKLSGLEHGHGGAHAKGAGDVATGGDHTPTATADDDGSIAKLRPVAFLYGGVEGIAIEVSDIETVKFRMPHKTRRAAGRAGAGIRRRPMAGGRNRGTGFPRDNHKSSRALSIPLCIPSLTSVCMAGINDDR